jgi:radical SAM protein with 4Fe4S-binding SPASM domain
MDKIAEKTTSETQAETAREEACNPQTVYEFDANHSFSEAIYREDWKEHRPKEYFEYRKMWDEVPRDRITTDFPIHLDIETTNICNLKCPMCPRTEMINNETFGEVGRMTKEQYADIIDQAAEYGTKSIKLNYLGEPLAHKDVVWQVEYAKQKGIVDVMMNSNATLLTKDRGRALLEAGLDNMFVSFDAVSPDLFAQQRVGTTLGKVIDNVYEFVKLRNESFPHVQVRVSMVMYNEPEWLEQFEGIKIMWKRLVDSVGYGFYTERDRNSFGEYPKVEGFWCAQPFQRMFLKYNGNVTICCVDDQDETIVGNWRLERLRDIWHNEQYTEIRRLHAEDEYYQMEMCRKCYLPVS